MALLTFSFAAASLIRGGMIAAFFQNRLPVWGAPSFGAGFMSNMAVVSEKNIERIQPTDAMSLLRHVLDGMGGIQSLWRSGGIKNCI